MRENEQELPVIYLKAGEVHVSRKPALVLTVLGSCLSVTMFHRRLSIGAICHGLLPQCRDMAECMAGCLDGTKYVDCSIHRMAKHFRGLGALPREIEVKVFGGADMFGGRGAGKAGICVGMQNSKKALEIIEKEGLRVSSKDLGGAQGRKIFFNTATGEVLLKRLPSNVVPADDGATT